MTHDRNWQGCVFIGTSLDGYIAKPDGDLTWLTDPTPRPHTIGSAAHPALTWENFYPNVDTLVMGRTTYETVLTFHAWPFDGKRVIVLSRTSEGDERVQVVRSVVEARELLSYEGAGRVYIDGGRTIQSFLAAGLIDEITVSIAPVLLGRGSRLFGDLDRDVLLTLRGHHATQDDGLLRATYSVQSR
ncbi:dihydrofolate reductase family protein [Arthrobacter sp. GMC3]|uniref:dihydrofolate reductase family protein n=1 Tax=Arthrobacter sp. GMC3 TaxID=2058894 RepID=UPI000CE454B2|nr:dihydrofolate reductase family protein [Arthrobacter sp. GMC3]